MYTHTHTHTHTPAGKGPEVARLVWPHSVSSCSEGEQVATAVLVQGCPGTGPHLTDPGNGCRQNEMTMNWKTRGTGRQLAGPTDSSGGPQAGTSVFSSFKAE